MNTLRRAVGVILIIIAAIVAVHTIIEPLYYTSTDAEPYSPVWHYLDWFAALAIVVSIGFAYVRVRHANSAGPDAPVTWERLAANALLYGLLFIAIMFFWAWFVVGPAFNSQFTGGSSAISTVWIIVDAAKPLLVGTTGINLLTSET